MPFRCIGLLRTLLETHENDPRLTDAGLRQRVAAMYLPLISIVMDAKHLLYIPCGNVSLDKEFAKIFA